jgi:hypothetical protein
MQRQVAKDAPDAGPIIRGLFVCYERGVFALSAYVLGFVACPFLFFGQWLIAFPLLAGAFGLFALARPRAVALTSSRLLIFRCSAITGRPNQLIVDTDRMAVAADLRSAAIFTTVAFEGDFAERSVSTLPTGADHAYRLVQDLAPTDGKPRQSPA